MDAAITANGLRRNRRSANPKGIVVALRSRVGVSSPPYSILHLIIAVFFIVIFVETTDICEASVTSVYTHISECMVLFFV